MSAIQKHALRIAILQALDLGGYRLPEKTLFIQINALFGTVTEAELKDALEWLKSKAYVDWTVEEISEEKRWTITESGKAKLP